MERLRRRLLVFSRLFRRDAGLLAKRAASEFIDDRCTQMAASISYWVFFSIFPLAIFLVTIFGQFLRDDNLRLRVLNNLTRVLPLAGQGRLQLEEALAGVSTDLSLLGLVSVVGLVWAASSMMTAIRISINVAWDHGYSRPPVRGKLVDILMVFVVSMLVALSLAVTTIYRFGVEAAEMVSVIPLESVWWFLGILLPFVVSFTIFTLLYKFVPVIDVRFSEVWPGSLIAALLFELTKHGFAFYVTNFSNYNAIYGGLSAIIVFLLFVYLTANILLFGAEIAAEWPRVRAGHYYVIKDAEHEDDDDGRSNWERVRSLAGSLFFLNPEQRDSKDRPRREPGGRKPS
ncbi:YihY/virulence factor BrkB family protein [soil metagenome]